MVKYVLIIIDDYRNKYRTTLCMLDLRFARRLNNYWLNYVGLFDTRIQSDRVWIQNSKINQKDLLSKPV